MNLLENFKCPDCGSIRLEEIMVNVVESHEVTIVDDEGLDYGEHNTDGGVVDRYQCMNCGKKIANDEEELFKVLKRMTG